MLGFCHKWEQIKSDPKPCFLFLTRQICSLNQSMICLRYYKEEQWRYDSTCHVFQHLHSSFFSVSMQSDTISSCDDHLHWLWSRAVIRQLCFTGILKHLRRKFCPNLSSLSVFYGHTSHLFLTVLADTQQQNSGKSILSHFLHSVFSFPLLQFQWPTCIWKMNMGYHLKLCQIQQETSFSTMKSS